MIARHHVIRIRTPNERNLKRFKCLFGVSPWLVSIIWKRVFCENPPVTEVTLRPIHLLWSLLFLKTYASETLIASYIGKDEKTFRKYNWLVLLHMAHSASRVVRFFFKLEYSFVIFANIVCIHIRFGGRTGFVRDIWRFSRQV